MEQEKYKDFYFDEIISELKMKIKVEKSLVDN